VGFFISDLCGYAIWHGKGSIKHHRNSKSAIAAVSEVPALAVRNCTTEFGLGPDHIQT
jgi:hypothetical protein